MKMQIVIDSVDYIFVCCVLLSLRYFLFITDVVAAYKGMAKEKEALEISLKALNKTQVPAEGQSKYLFFKN